MLNKLRKPALLLLARQPPNWTTKCSDESLHRPSLPNWNQFIQTLLSNLLRQLPNLRGVMPLADNVLYCCSRSLLLIARVCQDEGPLSILMLIARWLIKKWMLGML